jgi:hypothetical protein
MSAGSSRFLSFEDAKTFVRALGLTSWEEWEVYRQSSARPRNISRAPRHKYKDQGWAGVRDWLGPKYRSFEDARTFARSLGIAGQREWQEYSRSDARPSDIPGSPDSLYRDQGWAGIKDWLGAPPRYRFRTFEDARSYVWTLGIKSQGEWSKYCKSGGRPSDIPAAPSKVYKLQGWASWGDWLGTGYVSLSKRNFWLYEDARDFVRSLGIKTERQWREYCRSGNRPIEIPSIPNLVYKDRGWAGLGDWLGTGVIAHQNREWAPFEEARAFVRSLNLKSFGKWREYCQSGALPANIPTDPARIYKDHGWAGMGDWRVEQLDL